MRYSMIPLTITDLMNPNTKRKKKTICKQVHSIQQSPWIYTKYNIAIKNFFWSRTIFFKKLSYPKQTVIWKKNLNRLIVKEIKLSSYQIRNHIRKQRILAWSVFMSYQQLCQIICIHSKYKINILKRELAHCF